MNRRTKTPIVTLRTGVPGLDEVLGGGLPEFSFNLVAGAPGTGKTTLVHQFMFANATPEKPAIFFTVLGEPAVKMLRYQQQFDFFDPEKLGRAVRFLDLSSEAVTGDLTAVLERIVGEVEASSPGIIVVDSFRTIVRAAGLEGPPRGSDLQNFVQRLALWLTSWQATTFLVGEYAETEVRDNPVFTLCDGLLWLYQSVERNSVVRKLQVMKMRGLAPMPGLHTFRITDAGLQVFPRAFGLLKKDRKPRPHRRLSTGIAALDEMLGGGLAAGDSVLVAGPTGTGKTAICTQFIAEGIRRGEPGVIAVFEEHPAEYVSRAEMLGLDMEEMIARDRLSVLYLRPLDLSVDETMKELHDAVNAIGAKRVVIDSLSGFELALAPAFREDFRESLYRMVSSLTGSGVTVMNTVEVQEASNVLEFSAHNISFLTDDIIHLRYVELNAQLRKVMAIIKTRRGEHSKDLRMFDVTADGLALDGGLRGYRGILTGEPVPMDNDAVRAYGLTDMERAVLRAMERGEASVEDLSKRTGLRRAALSRALRRLVEMGYAAREGAADRTVYRATPGRADGPAG